MREDATVEAIRRHTTVTEDGQVTITELPFRKGQEVEVILLREDPSAPRPAPLTACRLLESGVVGLWKGRADIVDSAAFARRLRDTAQVRQGRRRARD